jgi:hypothetical protein
VDRTATFQQTYSAAPYAWVIHPGVRGGRFGTKKARGVPAREAFTFAARM